MKLSHPFSISSRLLPALVIDDCTISLEHVGYSSWGNRPEYSVYFDFSNGESVELSDLSGAPGASTQSMFASLLSFLGACGESRAYAARTGRPGEHADLFPQEIGEWAESHSDEISTLASEIEESELIED